ncbi:MAG TPA: transposase [Chloroflexota bacterium]|jgi:hypothetical protein
MGPDPANLSGERHPRRVLVEYATNFDGARPRQGIGQGIPASPAASGPQRRTHVKEGVLAVPVLGGLHREDHRAA